VAGTLTLDDARLRVLDQQITEPAGITMRDAMAVVAGVTLAGVAVEMPFATKWTIDNQGPSAPVRFDQTFIEETGS